MPTDEPAPRERPGDDRDQPAEVLTQIPGVRIDPEPSATPSVIRRLERTRPWTAILLRAYERFRVARAPLIAGGTAYYAFVAMFSLLAVAYGIAALLGADTVARWLTDALEEALPGLVGDQGIDPDALVRVGRTSSLVGLVLMLWSGAAVMVAASGALHHLYGAAPDGRNPLAHRVHLFAWLAVLGPLIVLSYTLTTAATGYGSEVLDAIGITAGAARTLVLVAATALTFLLDVTIMTLLLGRLGGIRPPAPALGLGASAGAALITVLKWLMAAIVAWSVDKPQYGSFALPVSVLVVLWLQSMALYAAASLTAGAAEAGWRPRVRWPLS